MINILHANIDVHSRRSIAEFLGYVVNFISKLQYHCANMTSADKSRYDRLFRKVLHKGGESAMNFIKRFQNAQDLSVSVGNSYSEDHFMYIFSGNFHQGRKYTAQIAIYQAGLGREKLS